MKYYYQRLKNNRQFKIAFILLFIFMNIDLLILNYQMPDYNPHHSTFLCGSSLGNYMQMLVLWLLPAYLLLGTSSWFIQDDKTKNSLILTTKYGKKTYLNQYLKTVFLSTFLLFFINFLINYLCAYIINYGEIQYSMLGYEYIEPHLSIQYQHPFLTNIFFSLITSLFFSFYAIFIACISFIFPKLSYVLLLSFSLWLIFISGNHSILLACQPFCEYSYNYLFKIYMISTLIILTPSFLIYKFKVKKDEL